MLSYSLLFFKTSVTIYQLTWHKVPTFGHSVANNFNNTYFLPTNSYTTNNIIILQHTHGGPDDEIRHAGDFGNILADEYGNASYHIQGTQISLCPSSVGYSVGRAFVVHAGTDDLGRGGNEESLRTGNAGGRLACCVVEAVNY